MSRCTLALALSLPLAVRLLSGERTGLTPPARVTLTRPRSL